METPEGRRGSQILILRANWLRSGGGISHSFSDQLLPFPKPRYFSIPLRSQLGIAGKGAPLTQKWDFIGEAPKPARGGEDCVTGKGRGLEPFKGHQQAAGTICRAQQ